MTVDIADSPSYPCDIGNILPLRNFSYQKEINLYIIDNKLFVSAHVGISIKYVHFSSVWTMTQSHITFAFLPVMANLIKIHD